MKHYWQKLIKELEKRNLLLAGFAVLLSLPIVLVAALLTPRSPLEVCVSRGVPDPTSFEAVCGLTHDEFAALDEAALVRWAQQKHGTAPLEYHKTVRQGVVYYSWDDDGNRYEAALVDGHIQTISIDYQQAGPSFCQVVERLGPPITIVTDWYRGVTGGNWYSIELEYPEQRLSFASSDFSDWYVATDTISRQTWVQLVYCFAQTAQGVDPFKEQFLEHCESSPDTAYAVRRRLPWPGFGATVLFGCER